MCELANAAARYSAATRIRCNYGMRGFGVYCAVAGLVEANPNRRILYDLPSICWELREEEDYVKKIIEDYGLFIIDDGYLVDAFARTPEMKEREAQEEKRRRRSEAGKKAAATRKANAELKKNLAPSFLTDTEEPTTETFPDAFPRGFVSESGVPYGNNDWASDELPRNEKAEEYRSQEESYDWNAHSERFERIRKYWNDIFINSNRPSRAYVHDETSMMKELLKETFAQFTDEQIEKAFDYAAKQEFTWEFRFTIKAKNIKRLLSEMEQEEWKMVNDLTIEQRELMQYAQDQDVLNWNYLRSEGRGRDIQWLPKDYYQEQQQQ